MRRDSREQFERLAFLAGQLVLDGLKSRQSWRAEPSTALMPSWIMP